MTEALLFMLGHAASAIVGGMAVVLSQRLEARSRWDFARRRKPRRTSAARQAASPEATRRHWERVADELAEELRDMKGQFLADPAITRSGWPSRMLRSADDALAAYKKLKEAREEPGRAVEN